MSLEPPVCYPVYVCSAPRVLLPALCLLEVQILTVTNNSNSFLFADDWLTPST
jgi:hypothetical protein